MLSNVRSHVQLREKDFICSPSNCLLSLVKGGNDAALKEPETVVFKKLEPEYVDESADIMAEALRDNYITHVEIQMGIASGPDTPSPDAVKIIRSQLADMLSDENACVMIALDGGKLAGIGIGRIEEEYGNRYGDFWDVVVRPESGGKGIGSRLIEMIHSFFRERGVKAIYLDVNPNNSRAISLYGRLGYETVTHVMRKELQPR